jgi:hypothetical protein
MFPVQYGKMPGSGWVCTNNRCWLGLSGIIYTKKGSSKLCNLMNTLTSFKLIKF